MVSGWYSGKKPAKRGITARKGRGGRRYIRDNLMPLRGRSKTYFPRQKIKKTLPGFPQKYSWGRGRSRRRGGAGDDEGEVR